MITKVVIKDNKRSPIGYLDDLKSFKNGKEFEFKEGVNIIVGENGCGKTTLMKLIERYLLVEYNECSYGMYNSNINELFTGFGDNKKLLDGVEVYADYLRNTFRLCHNGEMDGQTAMEHSMDSFSAFYEQKHSSTGEGVLIAMNALFGPMYGKNARLTFDYTQQAENYKQYVEYIRNHAVEGNEWTILMDEPDRNLSLENVMQIKGILSVHKPKTQIIAVIHNPLLICSLSKQENVNVIEMTRCYVSKVNKMVKELMK